MLDSPAVSEAINKGWSPVQIRSKLRKLALLHVNEYNILPSALFLRDVQRNDTTLYGGGSFASVYRGTYGPHRVALKQLKVYALTPEAERREMAKVSSRFMFARDEPEIW